MRFSLAPREGAAFVAEQLTLQQGFGNGGAIDGDERRAGAITVLVDGSGDELLARARLAPDEDVDGLGGHSANFLVDGLHGGALAYQGVASALLASQDDRLGHQPVAVGRLFHQGQQIRHVERLEQIVVSAEFGRLDGGFRGAKGGDQDDGEAGVGLGGAGGPGPSRPDPAGASQ